MHSRHLQQVAILSALLVALARSKSTENLKPKVGVVKRLGVDLELVLSTERAEHVASVMKLPSRRTVVTSAFFLAREADSTDVNSYAPHAWVLLKNLYGQMASMGIADNLIAVCAMYAQCVASWEAGFPAFLTHRTYHWTDTTNHALHGLATKIKFLTAYTFLSKGYDVLFSDWDVFFQPSTPLTLWDYIDTTPHDWIALFDVRIKDYKLRGSMLPEDALVCDTGYAVKPTFCHSTGLWHARASLWGAQFALDVWTKSFRDGGWEQARYNELAVYWSVPLPFNTQRPPLLFRAFPNPQVTNLMTLLVLEDVDMSTVHFVHCGWYAPHEKVGCLESGFKGRSFLRTWNATQPVQMRNCSTQILPIAEIELSNL